MKHNSLVIVGPTASGKTRLACQLALAFKGEIISADSRQVYRQLNIGTGKDLNEYEIKGVKISYHLIDIAEPGEQVYLHQYIAQLKECFEDIRARHKLPIICGGTGLYLDALRKDFSFTQIKENELLRKQLDTLSKEELVKYLLNYPEQVRNHVDFDSKKRLIRGIEVAAYRMENNLLLPPPELPYKPYYLGISLPAQERKRRITERLQQRLENGLIGEAEELVKAGISHQRLETLGLEYKFLSFYLQAKISKDELFKLLQTAIIQYSKRQMTWFRKMEKEGVEIKWLNVDYDLDEVINRVAGALDSTN